MEEFLHYCKFEAIAKLQREREEREREREREEREREREERESVDKPYKRFINRLTYMADIQ